MLPVPLEERLPLYYQKKDFTILKEGRSERMAVLVEWLGKADEISIAYDMGIHQNQILPGDASLGGSFPSIIYPESDNIRDVSDVIWEKTVSKADSLDYLMAICSGTISGLIDVFYVGEFSLERAHKWGSEEVNKFVKKVAKLQGFKGEDLSDAIKYLEKNFGLAADSLTADYGGHLQHHLRDFSHHFSLSGLLCSLFTQFTGIVIGTDTSGELLTVVLKDKTFIGKNFEEKILFGTVNWFFHMVSDMAGSSATAGKGAGIPGPIGSLIKELSTLPCFKDKKIGDQEFHVWVSKLFNGTLLGKHDENGKIVEPLKFDLRTEIGILHEVGKQFVPVLINECLVRSLYFIRRLYNAIKNTEIHSVTDLKNIDPSELLPFNNKVIRRMITIASGTFTAIDTVDAAVHAAIKSKGINPAFFVNFAVRINIVGVGRFIIACKADGQFITEEIREAKEQRDKIAKEYEKLISDLKALSLNYDQLRALNSIERLILEEDIEQTKKEAEKALKTEWMQEWSRVLTDNLSLVSKAAEEYFLSETEVVSYIEENESDPWMYLLAMEAMLFSPYYKLFKDDDKNKGLKKIKCNSGYLTDKFTALQDKITKEDFSKLKKAYKRATGIVTGSTKNVIIGAVSTTAAIVVTGGLAFAFAPVIAPILVGEAAAGLSGAALTSYSLAAIGGGSLAAGGFGMAGGTAIITGGGALVGMISGTGISAATTVNLLADDGYVLNECCKLITFSNEILVGKFNDISEVLEIQAKVEFRIDEIQSQIKAFSESGEDDGKKKEEMKLKVKIAPKSIKYLNRTANELKKITELQKPVEKKQVMLLEEKKEEEM